MIRSRVDLVNKLTLNDYNFIKILRITSNAKMMTWKRMKRSQKVVTRLLVTT